MALMYCPSCAKRISDKATVCSHCGFKITSATEEDILRKQRLRHMLRAQSLNNQSLLAILLFIAGFVILDWSGTRPSETEYYLAMGCSGVGLCWYVINRIRIMLQKRLK